MSLVHKTYAIYNYHISLQERRLAVKLMTGKVRIQPVRLTLHKTRRIILL